MASHIRDPGEASRGLVAGDHACAFHFGRAERAALLRAHLEAGLTAGETCFYVVRPQEATALHDRLTEAFGSPEHPRLVLPTTPGPRSPVSRYLGALDDDPSVVGMSPDANAVRVLSDLVWLRRQQRSPNELADYESHLRSRLSDRHGVALCLWDLDDDEPGTIADVLVTHPKLLLGGQVVASPWYVADQDQTSVGSDDSQVWTVLALGALMALVDDQRMIGRLAAAALRGVKGLELDGIFTVDDGWRWTSDALGEPQQLTSLEGRLTALPEAGGRLPGAGRARWGLPLQGPDGGFGHVVVSAEHEPASRDRFLTRLVVQQAGLALANTQEQERRRTTSLQLRHTRTALADATALLDWNMAVRERLKQVVTTGGGQHDIAYAVHDMTGHTVAVEDPDGNLTAWAGPEEPEPTDRSDAQRQQLIARAMGVRRPVHEHDRLVAVAHRKDHVLGLLSLMDPVDEIGEGEMLAVEDGATLLALELDHVRELAEAETRLGRNLLAELLDGNAEPAVVERARAIGFDVDRPHRVVVVESAPPRDADAFFHAVRRAARDTGFGPWLTSHRSGVVLVTDAGPPWEPLRRAILDESGLASCRLGVGHSHRDPSELPTSLRQAKLALKLQAVVGPVDQAVEFEQLGIYRLLADIAETTDLERYIATWLRPLEALLDYDEVNRSDLVATLSQYLESGGRHHLAAQALNVHRSTLKYRMQRIREITGCDLADPDTRFNLQLSTRAWQTLVRLRP